MARSSASSSGPNPLLFVGVVGAVGLLAYFVMRRPAARMPPRLPMGGAGTLAGAVRSLQQLLGQTQYGPVAPTGQWDETTKTAVRQVALDVNYPPEAIDALVTTPTPATVTALRTAMCQYQIVLGITSGC